MSPVTFSMHFRGTSSALSPGVLTARATAPSGALVTLIDERGPHSTFESAPGGEAHMECRLTFFDEEHFDEVGTISFGHGNTLRFRSLALGTLAAAGQDGLRLGSAESAIERGGGIFSGSSGRVVSTFVVADSGELADHQLAVVFLAR